jgi:hypothetical protein
LNSARHSRPGLDLEDSQIHYQTFADSAEDSQQLEMGINASTGLTSCA